MQAVFLRDTLDAAASDAEEQACFGVFFRCEAFLDKQSPIPGEDSSSMTYEFGRRTASKHTHTRTRTHARANTDTHTYYTHHTHTRRHVHLRSYTHACTDAHTHTLYDIWFQIEVVVCPCSPKPKGPDR